MTTYVYEHTCSILCPVQGEIVKQRPTIMGSYYLMVPIRCAYTHMELRLLRREDD